MCGAFVVSQVLGEGVTRVDEPRVSALRSRRINGAVYIRQEDVVAYLRDTARDWLAGSSTEITLITSDCVRQIADRLAKVQA